MKKVFKPGVAIAAPAIQEPLVAGPAPDNEEQG
jgi:hypothetical protein